ncbi:MAG: ABC transporter ATP-binding protein/permease [Saprospiraceae bacterium]|nr:ABC transporter ATP-binding protein/permease [Saprospiraceae bacterium]
MGALKAVNKYFWKYRLIYGLGLLFTLLSNFFGSFAPAVVGQAVDFAFKGTPMPFTEFLNIQANSVNKMILIAAIIIVTLTLLRGLFLFLMRRTIIVASHRIVADLRNDLYSHYQTLDQTFYKRNSTGDLMSRLTEDVSNVRMYAGPSLMYFVNMVAMFGFYIYQMMSIDVVLTFWVLLPLPLLSLSIYIVSSIIFKKNKAIQVKLSGLTSLAQETFSGVRVIKSYAREEAFQGLFEKEAEEYKQDALSLARTEAFFFPLMLILIGLSTIIAVYVGGQHVEKGLIDVGMITSFVIYVGALTWPVTSLGWIASLVQKAAASQKRINEFMDTNSAITSDPSEVAELSNEIEFKNVSFTYEDSGIQAVKNVSFDIKSGEKVAIIGRTGSGKTTIADLLLRVFDPQSGTIALNGKDIKTFSLHELREFIGYVPQDVFLFSDTIANNISITKNEASLDEIKHAAQSAAVAKDIERFPDQYDTVVGERGVMLSGGQKQRISIARALIKDPALLILDDALSAVDAETEKEILDEFDALFKNKTVLVITHRIFTLFDVDKIMVLDDGEIVEMGTHEQLYKQKGIYYELYELQSADQNF